MILSRNRLWIHLLLIALPLALSATAAAAPAASDAPATPATSAPAPTETATSAPSTTRAVEQLFTKPVQAEWFDPAFLTHVSTAQITAVIHQLEAQFGDFVRVDGSGGKPVVVLAKGEVPAQVTLNANGQIQGLLFGNARARVSNLDGALAQLRSLPGQVSVLVTRDGATLGDIDSHAPMAVGSAFKLAVLAALDRQIQSGQRAWNDVVTLKDKWRSLPSGVLQTWPSGLPVTLGTLAAEMISISDNTAADALIDVVGRSAIEPLAPGNAPFLTVREATILKSPANADLLAAWRAADTTGRRALLPQIDARSLPSVGELSSTPRAQDIEWFFSTRQLCRLMDQVHELPVMQINPGPADKAAWAQVAYKGGSDAGVLSLVTQLTGRDGREYCVAAIWNDLHPVDENQLLGLYGGLLGVLHREG